MTGGFLDGDIFRGLAFRMLLFLTLALLPFGLISVFQTREIAKQLDYNTELSLLARTDQALLGEQLVLQEGFGVSRALSAVRSLHLNKPGACADFLRSLEGGLRLFEFAGYVTAQGEMPCASEDRSLDRLDLPGLGDDNRPPQRWVDLWGNTDGRALLALAHPLEKDGVFAGYVLLGVSLADMSQGSRAPLPTEPIASVMFNSAGKVVRATAPLGNMVGHLPQDLPLTGLVGQASQVFRMEANLGGERIYAVVPIVPEVAYSMNIWRPEDLGTGLDQRLGLSTLLPVLMWLASLVVAFWSLNRLAVRHIRKMGRQMRLFAYNRKVPRTSLGPGVPQELVDIQAAFARMAESIVRDEAALEDSLRDKNILLKEVHHRVKNNLQLISSIMNMQIRRAQSEDARQVLQRLQDRILSLATVHKNLYQTNELDRVDAGALLEEIVEQLLAVGLPAGRGVEVAQNYATVEMDADDAAPFTLLVSEAVTNALKYLGRPRGEAAARLDISFSGSVGGEAVFRISNTTAGALGSSGTGLGTQLISAFARQLDGKVDVDFQDNLHVLQISFPLRQRSSERYDF